MPNQDLKDKLHNKDGDEKEKYTALAMQESRLNKAKEYCQKTKDCAEFNRLGGDTELKRLEALIHTAQNANYQVKKTGMDAGRENQFIEKHEKDRDNANPTAIGGMPKVNKGSIKDKIMTNKEVYNEGISKEITDIRYLIEYMSNNNKKQKL
jgi:hypothetical protein